MAKPNLKETVELIGVLAIVISLGSLVYELRQTQSALLAETYQARAIDAIGELLSIADGDHLIPILTATNEGADFEAVANLSANDRLRLVKYLQARMIDWDNEHYQYQNGFLNADFFEATTTRSVRKWAPRCAVSSPPVVFLIYSSTVSQIRTPSREPVSFSR
jgi:hypothetical protein